jgi:hypothetical protein
VSAPLGSPNVFINCPFDKAYRPVFEAVVFTVYNLGFAPRCALEVDDGSQVRIEKIATMIAQCPYGVHDLSWVGIDPKTRLPRFNMPLELGLYLGCQRFGGKSQRAKNCLILDRHPFRYRAFMSDISGQDIHAYNGTPRGAIAAVRDWLCAASKRGELPGGAEMYARYCLFRRQLPGMCRQFKRRPSELTYMDYSEMALIWLSRNR